MKFSAYVVLVIAVLAGLFYFFRPAQTPLPQHASDTPSAVASTAPAGGASGASEPAAASQPTGSPTATAPAVAADTTVVDLVVAKGHLASGPNVVQVKQNQHIVFHVTSDAADEMHLHGYNLHLHLKPGEQATLDFVATQTGRFTYELHHTDLELGAIEIYPR